MKQKYDCTSIFAVVTTRDAIEILVKLGANPDSIAVKHFLHYGRDGRPYVAIITLYPDNTWYLDAGYREGHVGPGDRGKVTEYNNEVVVTYDYYDGETPIALSEQVDIQTFKQIISVLDKTKLLDAERFGIHLREEFVKRRLIKE